MTITEKDITGAYAKSVREGLGMTQTSFWAPLGVKQSVACRYEKGVDIPLPVRILFVARYVSGVQIDAQTEEGVAALTSLGEIQAKQGKAKDLARTIRADVIKASKRLQQAADDLHSI